MASHMAKALWSGLLRAKSTRANGKSEYRVAMVSILATRDTSIKDTGQTAAYVSLSLSLSLSLSQLKLLG